jgi:hypothetical protein
MALNEQSKYLSGVTYSVLAGISAASASVFGKLAMDSTVIHNTVFSLLPFEENMLDKVYYSIFIL